MRLAKIIVSICLFSQLVVVKAADLGDPNCSSVLLVSNYSTNNIKIYDGCSGEYVRDLDSQNLIEGPLGLLKAPDGDLLIVMEDRHIDWLGRHTIEPDFQVCLLGLWCRPRFALLYDPYDHPRAYFESCFDRVDRAVVNLLQERRSAQGN